ncbi:hypothetical protein FZEAL_1302 [Fusarium zealandicum]|uniref:Arp2/3 complex 41 kDa subunit n=1 Tax=Fusarium zealandicum TaxID=1053134 RepID=A0A8H4XPM1_9HYPO|nr:hypothetical protein FZEAL_1302 [Fusarium zealandicum]
MAAPQVHHLFHNPIADHSFSADHSVLAVARDTAVELYGKDGNAYRLKDELKGHDKTVTSVDIAPNSGRIVTCSQDRNALVWEPSPTGYKPTLVLLRISRAATFVRWSPSETKFAVGSGDRVIAVCYFEEENDWWVSKHLKKPIRSTITSVAWHPNSVLLAAGSTDAHARVFSSFIKGMDARPAPGVWGERLPFNTVCGEFLNNSAGWVHSVAFSPSGESLAFAAHDSSITVVYPSGPEQPPRAVVTVSTQQLPFKSLIWTSEDEIIAAGYDCEAFRFQGGEDGWQLAGTIETKGRPGLGEHREESALNMFRQMDLKGKAKDDTQLKTVHQNTISTLRPFEIVDDRVTKFSTHQMYIMPESSFPTIVSCRLNSISSSVASSPSTTCSSFIIYERRPLTSLEMDIDTTEQEFAPEERESHAELETLMSHLSLQGQSRTTETSNNSTNMSLGSNSRQSRPGFQNPDTIPQSVTLQAIQAAHDVAIRVSQSYIQNFRQVVLQETRLESDEETCITDPNSDLHRRTTIIYGDIRATSSLQDNVTTINYIWLKRLQLLKPPPSSTQERLRFLHFLLSASLAITGHLENVQGGHGEPDSLKIVLKVSGAFCNKLGQRQAAAKFSSIGFGVFGESWYDDVI